MCVFTKPDVGATISAFTEVCLANIRKHLTLFAYISLKPTLFRRLPFVGKFEDKLRLPDSTK